MAEDKVDYEIKVIWTENHFLKAEELYVFISQDTNGNEGICAVEMVLDERRILMPLIASDKEWLSSLTGHARNLARRGDKKIKLIKFTNREEIQEIEGEG